MKVKIKRKLRPIEVLEGQPHLMKSIAVYCRGKGTCDLPEGTLVKEIVYYGPRGPRKALYSIDNGESWIKGFYWNALPLSEGTEVKYV